MTDLTKLTDQQLVALKEQTEQKIAEYHNRQMALKILLNGGYGAMSNQFNRWYSDDVAESITLSGQLSARWIIKHINAYYNNLFNTEDVDYVIACDTDSVHLNVEPFVKQKFGKQIPDNDEVLEHLKQVSQDLDVVIKEGYHLLSEELNVYEPAMHMKLEAISKAVWTGKKHYAMIVWIGEGGVKYNPPKLKLVGIEAVKSSTPQVCRDLMKQAIPLIIDGDIQQLKQFIDEKRKEFYTYSFEQIAFPRSLSDVEKYADPMTIYGKKCPPHVRGALVYNHFVISKKLSNQLRLIQSGDKIRFCYMKLPNPFKENIFTCPDNLPEILQLDEYIDYDTQFEKSFIEPLNHLTKAVGMHITDDIDISQFLV